MMEFTPFQLQIKTMLPQMELYMNEPMAKHTSFRIGGGVEVMAFPKNREELARLQEVGVCPVLEEAVAEGIFTGEAVVLTGSLSSFKRSEAQKLIEERGGVCQSSVTAKTTLVIAGEEAGSKLEKAKKLGVKIIDEAAFKEMLEK